MKILPNIEITSQELELMVEDNIFDLGGEAVVCKNKNPHTLFKIFTTQPYTFAECPEFHMSDNKLKKLIRLHEHPIEGLVSPTATLTNKGRLIGYEMPYDQNDEALINAILTRNEKIYFLYQLKDILLELAQYGITYGDIKDDNVLINLKTGQAKFCDIDNMRVQELPIDVMGYGLREYYSVIGQVDEKADAYMHNLLVLEQLKYSGLSHKEILNILATTPYLDEFPEESKRVFSSLTSPKTFNGDYAIQYIKRT